MPDVDQSADEEDRAVPEPRDNSSGRGAGTDRSRELDERIRAEALEAQVERLHQDRESLRTRVADLEEQLDALEDERDRLAETVRHKEQQRQRTIENYERVLAETERRCREQSRSGAGSPLETLRKWTGGHWSALGKRLVGAVARLRRRLSELRD